MKTMFVMGLLGVVLVVAFSLFTIWDRGRWRVTSVSKPEPIQIKISPVSAGGAGFAIMENGDLWAWGRNSDGRLGDGTTEDRDIPVKIMYDVIAVSAGSFCTMAIKSDSSLWAWGHGIGSSPVRIMDDIVAISQSTSPRMAITSDGTLWAWGENSRGELGILSTRGERELPRVRGNISSAWISPIKVFEYIDVD